MRIPFLTIDYPPTGLHGSAIYARNMARALASRGHEVHVLDCTGNWAQGRRRTARSLRIGMSCSGSEPIRELLSCRIGGDDAGRSVVCTSAVGLAEYVEGTGAGTVVAPTVPAALAEALKPYLEDSTVAAKAGERARELVRTRFSPAAIACKREAAYEEAIRRWSRRRRG